MHIPDGYLGPITYGGLWVAAGSAWIYASKKIKKTLRASQVPFLALSSAFSTGEEPKFKTKEGGNISWQ